MDPLIIRPTGNTPEIRFDFDQGELALSGIVDPEVPGEFFEEPLNKLKGYLTDLPLKTRMTFALRYVRPVCIKYLLEILQTLKRGIKGKSQVQVQWEFEEDDESIQELGEDLEPVSGFEFVFIRMGENKKRSG